MNSPAINWYVLKTRPIHRVEFSVLHAITQREHPAMVPFEEKWIMRRKRRIKVKFPLFPSYVFVGLRDYQEFLDLKAQVNEAAERVGRPAPIINLIGYGRTPATLSESDVEFLRRVSVEGPTQINLHNAFKAGSKVQILDGPFAGHTATVDSVTKKSVKTMLTLFGSWTPVEIEHASVRAA